MAATKTRKNNKQRKLRTFTDEELARSLAILKTSIAAKLISQGELRQLQYSITDGSDRGKQVAVEAAECIIIKIEILEMNDAIEAWWDVLRDYAQDALTVSFPSYGQRGQWLRTVRPALDWVRRQEENYEKDKNLSSTAQMHAAQQRNDRERKRKARQARDRAYRAQQKGGSSKKN